MGCLVLVVGPSGSGKDTLLDYARESLKSEPRFRFVRRVITRHAGVGESHESVTKEEFEHRVAAAGFALHWRAHGLSYGVPAIVLDWVTAGCVVVTNGSRTIITEARSRFPTVKVVNVTAPRSVLAERLAARGREGPGFIVERLERSNAFTADSSYEIDNSGSIEQGGRALTKIILGVTPRSP